MKSVTVAGIDCGTNSIRLKIARVDDQGMHEIVPRILRVIRLGQTWTDAPVRSGRA